jgi:hypothetical protein
MVFHIVELIRCPPSFWNKLNLINSDTIGSNFIIYYGWDAQSPKNIYFKFMGNHLGWIGMGKQNLMLIIQI